MFLILFLITLAGNLNLSEASRILVVCAMGTKSHTAGFEPLYHELGRRGHNVTILTSFIPQKSPLGVKYIKSYDVSVFNQFMQGNIFEYRLNGVVITMFDLIDAFTKVCEILHQNEEVLQLFEEDYDLVIMNSFSNECMYGLVSHIRKAKVMMFSTLPLIPWTSSFFGNPILPSTIPLFTDGLTDQMTFMERLRNFLATTRAFYLKNYVYNPAIEKVYKSFLPNSLSIPEVEAKTELILMNSHPIINYPRAYFPNMIETSGLHCKDSKPLPQDLEDFIQGAGKHGFIYFSMGSFLQGKDLPEDFRISFLEAFRKLKQRVIWKFETEEMPNLPPNVKLAKWLPQQDILAHPLNRLFITHGGLLSLQEAAYHGVPLLGIPLFGDQDTNLALAQRRGIALTLNFEEITEQTVTENIAAALKDHTRLQANAKKVSSVFRDSLKSSLELAVYWTEYLLRHNDTSHLYTPARSLNFFQYHLLDVFGLLLFMAFTVIILIYTLLKLIVVFVCKFRKIQSVPSTSKRQAKKQKTK